MHYPNVTTGIFLSRPNRFLAHVRTEQGEVVCHVKNTGRLKELLLPGTRAAVQFHPDAAAMGRKTAYSLIAVTKPSPAGEVWVNIDSQAPNQAAYEWLTEGCGLPFCPAPENVRREVRFQDSRFDLSFSYGGQTWFMEVKGVTLDKNGTAMFPDAPTERGIKHLNELSLAAASGYSSGVCQCSHSCQGWRRSCLGLRLHRFKGRHVHRPAGAGDFLSAHLFGGRTDTCPPPAAYFTRKHNSISE